MSQIISLFYLVVTTSCSAQLTYPPVYSEYDLPQYDKAEIVNLSPNVEDLQDGIKIFLESDQDYAAIRAFYENHMAAKGWQIEEPISIQKMRELGKLDSIPFSGVWTKDDLKYQIFSSRTLGPIKINITFLKL